MYSEELEVAGISPQEALEGAIDSLADKFGFEIGVTDYFVRPALRCSQFCNQRGEIVWRVRVDFVNPDQETYNGCERGDVSYPETT